MVTETAAAAADWNERRAHALGADTTLDDRGFRLYLRDLDAGDVWSSTSGDGEMLFHAHMVEIRHRVRDDLAAAARVRGPGR